MTKIDFILTNAAYELISKVLSGKTLNFTRMAVGDGFSYDLTAAKNYTALVNEVLSLDITKKETLSASSVKVTSAFKNTDAQKEFYYREVGLYAQDPDTGEEILYAYGNRNDAAELITPTGSSVISKQLAFIIAVGNSANVTFNVNANVYALQEDMVEVKADITMLNSTKANDAETKQAIALERERINNLAKLKEGSTTGDAELVDGRVGANGKTYQTIGESIRGQISTLHNENGVKNLILEFELGTVGGEGALEESTNRIRTKNRISFTDEQIKYGVYFWVPAGYKLFYCPYPDTTGFYTGQNNVVTVYATGYYVLHPESPYYRIIIGKVDDSDFAETTQPISITYGLSVANMLIQSRETSLAQENSFIINGANFEIGTLDNQIYGREKESDATRCRTTDYIHVRKGYKISSTNYEYIVFYYDFYNKKYIYSYDVNPSWISDITFEKDYAIKLIVRDKNNIPIGDVNKVKSDIVFNFSGYTTKSDIASVKSYISTGETKSDSVSWVNKTVSWSPSYEEQNGELVDSTTRICTENRFFLDGDNLHIDIADGYKACYASYTDYSEIPGETLTDFKTGKLFIKGDKKYYRIIVGKTDDSTITVEESSNIAISYKAISKHYAESLYNARCLDGFSKLKDNIEKYTDAYISNFGYLIGGVQKKRSEIYDWILNGNNCIYRGKLKKDGLKLVDKNNKPVILYGIGTHELLNYKELHTKKSLETLKYYGVNCIRLSTYLTSAYFNKSNNKKCKGYLDYTEEVKLEIEEIVESCKELGLYAILDWHAYHSIDGGDVTQYKAKMVEYFDYFSQKYANYDNVLYELLNEPYQNTASELRECIVDSVNAIKEHVKNPVIIVGHGSGDTAVQDIHSMLNSIGIDAFISPHYYTGEQAVTSITAYHNAGIPIFISEWGNSDLSGAGTMNDDRAYELLKLCYQYEISNCVWKLTYQDMETSVLRNDYDLIENCYKNGGYSDSDLTHNGKLYFKNFMFYNFEKRAKI